MESMDARDTFLDIGEPGICHNNIVKYHIHTVFTTVQSSHFVNKEVNLKLCSRHIIILTQNITIILKTITSRCHVMALYIL